MLTQILHTIRLTGNRRCDGPPMGRIPSGERQAQQLTPRENAMTTNDDQKPKDTTEADSSAGVSCAAAAGSPSEAAVQYADYILNHYSRHSHKDKLCLARDLEESHGWTPNNDIVNLLRLYGWKAEESLQMFLHRMKANDQSEPHGLTTKL